MKLHFTAVEPLVGPTGTWHMGQTAEANPRDEYETCDHCGRHILARQTHFDGESFLCSACVRHSSHRRKDGYHG